MNRATVEDYERELSAVMPKDFKDWWQNSKREWPEVAAMVIRDNAGHLEDAYKHSERLEARVKELESDLAACREFQDIAEARVAELESTIKFLHDGMSLIKESVLCGPQIDGEILSRAILLARATLVSKEEPK